MTPVELWSDFNPVADELDINVVRSWENDGAIYEKIYFTAKKSGDAELRAYALSARPKKKGKFPTVLILPESSGKELNESLFGGMEKEGYCMIAVDLEGEKEGKSRYTFYPDDLDYCNEDRAGRHMLYAEPSAKETVWYNRTLISRRAITLIGELPYADEEKIVVLGVGNACPVLWQTTAMDARVIAGVSVLGYNFSKEVEEQEEMDCWMSGVDMRSYAPFITVPMLHVSGTNDTNNVIEIIERTVEKTTDGVPFYEDFTFGATNTLTRKQISTVKEFLKKVFAGEPFNEIPTFETETGIDGEFKVKINAPSAKSTELWYAYVGDSKKTFWKKVDSAKKSGDFIANFSLALGGEKVVIYVRANYGKYCLTSRPKFIQTSTSGASVPEKRSTKILFDGTTTSSILPVVDSRIVEDDVLEVKEGALGLMGVTSKGLGLGYIFDPEQPIDVSFAGSLQFEIFTLLDVSIEVAIYSEEQRYSAVKNLRGGTGWQRVQLSNSAFKNLDMQKLSSFDEAWKVEFVKINGALVRNVLLV